MVKLLVRRESLGDYGASAQTIIFIGLGLTRQAASCQNAV
jgi:hypothetical protein